MSWVRSNSSVAVRTGEFCGIAVASCHLVT
jgi:hypothetical protein